MGGARNQQNKAHKTRFASKSTRNLHKTSLQDKHRISKSKNVAKGARAARQQRNKNIREEKRAAVLKQKRASTALTSPPKLIVLFGLSADVDVDSLYDDLLKLLSPESTAISTVASSDYKLRATVMKAPHGDLLSCMEMAKVADLIVFVASANGFTCEDGTFDYIDSFGSRCLSVFRSLGLPSSVVMIRGLPTEMRSKNDLKKICISGLVSEFPKDCKFYPADTKDELHKFMWLFREQRLTAPIWRNQRPYLVAQKVQMEATDDNAGTCTLLLTGYLRARNLSVNQLVHVSGAGDFQLAKAEVMKDPFPLAAKKGLGSMDVEEVYNGEVIQALVPDPVKREPLLVENIPDPLAGEQTWPTEEEMAEAADRNQNDKKLKKRRLPKGTSDYQAAWIVDDTDEEETDNESGSDDGMEMDVADNANDSEFDDDQATLKLEYSDEETENDSVMMDTENLTKEQIEDEIKKLKEEHAEDKEYPDEVDTPIDVPARKRFAKYRGLKSFKTSQWDPKESLPAEYARIFAFDNFKRTQKLVLKRASEMEQGDRDDCVLTGSYTRLHIKDVPVAIASKLCALVEKLPVIACGLLEHESKMSVLHFSLQKDASYSEPIKAKEELIFHVGFRQFMARPIFSTNNINLDKHKMERFLHEGFAMATIYGPVCFPPLPLIVLKSGGEGVSHQVAAAGALSSIDPDRIILKKIILTGYPQRVHKVKSTIRYMFHNPEDVRWFKPVELRTKCGRYGRIKESVGTHGTMKCIFNEVIQQHDTDFNGNEALVQIVNFATPGLYDYEAGTPGVDRMLIPCAKLDAF
ncbi:hypothetical protein ACFE04_011973 [Oxalis oulophora]